jgi:hypothetical protein
MSDRINQEWTENLEDAFGKSDKLDRGVKAESMFLDYAKTQYYKVKYYDSDRDMQNLGIDFEVWEDKKSEPIGIDVKSTLRGDGDFPVENHANGWIRNPKKKSKFIVHLNVEDGRAIQYDRESMIRYLDEVVKSEDELVWLQIDDFSYYQSSKGPLRYKKYWVV